MLIGKRIGVCELEETHVPPIGLGMRLNQANRIRAGNITLSLLVAISIAMSQGVGHAQMPVASREPTLPPSTTANDRSRDNQLTSVHEPSDQMATRPCRLQLQDPSVEPPANSAESKSTIGTMDYTPLSTRCKFNLFVKQTHEPSTFVSAAFQATLDQAEDQWPEYGGGVQGWGKRFGATLADTESRRFIQTVALSTILHQDPRYFPSPKKSLISRSWYAATRVVITRNDSGNNTFNTSELLGTLFTSSLQNSYYPRRERNFSETMNRFTGALSSDAIGNLQREFMPDIKRLFRKHEPKEIRKIEDKLPIPADDKP
jgi:hypothetical protein